MHDDYRAACVDCDKEFYLPADIVAKWRAKGLHMPRRCYPCRQARRRYREKLQKDANKKVLDSVTPSEHSASVHGIHQTRSYHEAKD